MITDEGNTLYNNNIYNVYNNNNIKQTTWLIIPMILILLMPYVSLDLEHI